MSHTITLRTIAPHDNQLLATIVRDTLKEFGSDEPGTAYFDPTTDQLFELFSQERSCYYVALLEGHIVGGAGICPTAGLPADVCELSRLYLLPQARGTGLGKQLVSKCLETAQELGYRRIYLETTGKMKKALPLYEKFGFHYLTSPLGNSGHFGCDIWMIREI